MTPLSVFSSYSRPGVQRERKSKGGRRSSHKARKRPLLPGIPSSCKNGPGDFQYLNPMGSWLGALLHERCQPPSQLGATELDKPSGGNYDSGEL